MENFEVQGFLQIAVIIGGLLIVILRNHIVDISKALLPDPKLLGRYLLTRGLVPESVPKRFTILIADLDGDDRELRQTSYIDAALRHHAGLEIIRIGPGPRPFVKGTRSEADAAGISYAQKELIYHRGDIYIFGEVAKADARLRLRFVATLKDGDSKHGSYGLEGAELPLDFTTDFHAVLLVQILEAVSPVINQEGRFVADLLHPILPKLEHLVDEMPADLDTDERGLIQHSFGMAAYRVGEQLGTCDLLETAVLAFRAALAERTQARVPLEWARTQSNLGNALTELGSRESSSARLEEAVSAYRSALEERTRERVPLDWARTQNNLGNVLSIIGEREGSAARLREAIVALRSALEERAREHVPHDWATTQTNLGIAFQLIGVRERKIEFLEDAVSAFESALEEFSQDRVPLRWAATQNNLGNALAILGEWMRERAVLERAVSAFRAALEERSVEKVPLDWATTQNNLGAALMALGEKEDSIARLKEAVIAFESSLRQRTRERVPLHWAMTQENLGLAFRLIAERSWDSDLANQAVETIHSALEVFEDIKASGSIRKAKLNLVIAKEFQAMIEGQDRAASSR